MTLQSNSASTRSFASSDQLQQPQQQQPMMMMMYPTLSQPQFPPQYNQYIQPPQQPQYYQPMLMQQPQQQYPQYYMMQQQQQQQQPLQQPMFIPHQPSDPNIMQSTSTTPATGTQDQPINLVPNQSQQQQPMMQQQPPQMVNIDHSLPNKKVPPPINQDVTRYAKIGALEEAANQWLKKRLELIAWLEEMICALNKRQKSSAKTKVGGTATNIIGTGLIIGGIVAAPFTLGGSLLASTAGIGCIGAGTTATVVASYNEWKYAKKSAGVIQELLQKDTEMVNSLISKIYEYRSTDPLIETRTICIGTVQVGIVNFVNSLICFGRQELNTLHGVTYGNTGTVSLAGLMIKGTVPVIAIPVDMVLLVKESKKLNKKEPSKLAVKIIPIMEQLKLQTKMASGAQIP